MLVRDAQREVRTVFLGGFPGQAVSGTLWLISAALGTWASPRQAMLFLVIAGSFIFPLTQLMLKLMGRRASLSPGNPLNGLAMQIAFTVPLSLPLIGAATLHRAGWFFPAFMVVVGAHYLPFVFLYGMWTFAVLAGLLLAGGVAIGLFMSGAFSLGGWLTGALLLLFAFIGRSVALRDERAA
jgi:hypothetical protein